MFVLRRPRGINLFQRKQCALADLGAAGFDGFDKRWTDRCRGIIRGYPIAQLQVKGRIDLLCIFGGQVASDEGLVLGRV